MKALQKTLSVPQLFKSRWGDALRSDEAEDETNIRNEPNTTYSAKMLVDRFNQPIKYEGNPAALAGLAEDIVDALKRQRLLISTLREPRGRQGRR